MDTGERSPMPPPAQRPSSCTRSAHAQREGLEAIFWRANGSKQSWDRWVHVLNRSGELGPRFETQGEPEGRPATGEAKTTTI